MERIKNWNPVIDAVTISITFLLFDNASAFRFSASRGSPIEKAPPVSQPPQPQTPTSALLFAAVLMIQLALLISARPFPSHLCRSSPSTAAVSAADERTLDKVFVYDLPPFFNKESIDIFTDLNPQTSRCNALSNKGFGLSVATDLTGVVPLDLLPSWFSTNQFAVEIIYHRRMLSHRCLTLNPSASTAFYISFYVSLAIGKNLWSSTSTSSERGLACAKLLGFVKVTDQLQRLHAGCGGYGLIVKVTSWL